jgi:hypothetical protein
VDSGKLKETTVEMRKAFLEMQAGLILPISPYDAIRVIKAAREYEALSKSQ